MTRWMMNQSRRRRLLLLLVLVTQILLLASASNAIKSLVQYPHSSITTREITTNCIKIGGRKSAVSVGTYFLLRLICWFTKEAVPNLCCYLHWKRNNYSSISYAEDWKHEPPPPLSVAVDKAVLSSVNQSCMKLLEGGCTVPGLLLTEFIVFSCKQALALVFVETKKGADSLEHWLCMNGFPATTIHRARTHQANSEVSALLGRISSAVGYQPTIATDLGGLEERITTKKISVQAIYVPADDLTDRAPATTFAHLDATTVLSRQVPVRGATLGPIMNVIGEPIVHRGNIKTEYFLPIHREAPSFVESGVIKLGDKQGDSKYALVYGQMNEPPGACARVGHTGLIASEHFRDAEGQDILHFIDDIFRFTQANSEVSALLGRIPFARGVQKVLQNYKNFQDSTAILGMDELSEDDKLTVARSRKIQRFLSFQSDSKCALVYGQMDGPPGARACVGLTGLIAAEHSRDAEGQDVLIFIDTQAISGVSTLPGRIPSAVVFQPTLATDLGCCIYLPADDLTDPAPATTFAHLDAVTVLSRKIYELGIHHAAAPLDSTSCRLSPYILGEDHYNTARGVQKVLQKYKNLQDITAIP